ncbi:hypothetical protein PtB15_11B190 [Puccinia triticina]|nr:hypothetical protein PtB15_11B190 [Puccinia triticina]
MTKLDLIFIEMQVVIDNLRYASRHKSYAVEELQTIAPPILCKSKLCTNGSCNL